MPEFDTNGETVETTEEIVNPPEAAGEGEVEIADPPAEGEAVAEGKTKYKIGDQEFATLAEAQAYATSQVQQGDENAAYRRIVQELIKADPTAPGVTPPTAAAPKIDEEKLWANPGEFLQEFAGQIKKQTMQEVGESLHQQRVRQENDEALFAEFTNRHPDLADFRSEVDEFTGKNIAAIRNLATTKGRPAAYDYIALHLRDRFQKYAQAAKPRRALPNGGANAPAARSPSGVTPAKSKNKPLSLAEQIRTIKKVKR